MAYLPNIPLSTDDPSIGQAQFLNNFGILGAIAGNVNPSSSAINNTAGFNWLYLPANGSTPPAGAAFTAGQIGVYSATSALTTQSELYINKTNQATVVQVPSTASTLSVTSAPTIGSGGWTYLPSGILLMFGSATGLTGAQLVTVPSGANIPLFNQILTVLVCPFSSTAGDKNFAVRLMSVVSTTQFEVYVSNRTTTGSATGGIQYIAIGY